MMWTNETIEEALSHRTLHASDSVQLQLLYRLVLAADRIADATERIADEMEISRDTREATT